MLAGALAGTSWAAKSAEAPCSIESPVRSAMELAQHPICTVAAEVRANVDARSGGTLRLPDGTLVSLTPKALPENALVDVVEYAESAVGTPRPGWTFVGPSLRVAIEAPEPGASTAAFSQIPTTLPLSNAPDLEISYAKSTTGSFTSKIAVAEVDIITVKREVAAIGALIDRNDLSVDFTTAVFPAFPKIGAQIVFQLVQRTDFASGSDGNTDK